MMIVYIFPARQHFQSNNLVSRAFFSKKEQKTERLSVGILQPLQAKEQKNRRAMVIFTRPWLTGTRSPSESIPFVSALKCIILQRVHITYWLNFHWKHCRGFVCVCVCVCVGRGMPFVLVLLSAREISIFIMLLSHSILKWYQPVIKSRPVLFFSYCVQFPDITEDWWSQRSVPSPPNPNYTSGKAKAMGSACNLLKHNHPHA